MDPTIAGHLTLTGALIVAVLWFNKREKRAERLSVERHRECETRNGKLEQRVETMEKRQFEILADLTERGIAGLAENTAVLKRVMGDPPTPIHFRERDRSALIPKQKET
jgi:hypothetical protein